MLLLKLCQSFQNFNKYFWITLQNTLSIFWRKKERRLHTEVPLILTNFEIPENLFVSHSNVETYYKTIVDIIHRKFGSEAII